MSALAKLEGICAEIYSQWDKDMRSGKLLSALAGGIPRYRQDVTDVREALAELDRLRATEARLRAALESYKEYTDLLAKSEASMMGLAYAHGWRCPPELIARGESLRTQIASFSDEQTAGGDAERASG